VPAYAGTDARGLIVLDFDGVLLDTEHISVRVWRHLIEHTGLRLRRPLPVRDDRTLDRDALWRELVEVSGPERSSRLWQEFERLNRGHAERAELMPGASAFLAHCRARGHRLAVASSNSRDWVEGHLRRLGIRPWFSAVSCADDDMPAKPAPDTYLHAVRRGGGRHCSWALAVEDSHAGLAAAHAAGLPAVWVTDAAPPARSPIPLFCQVRALDELTAAV
jgi:putative hydrolase of the HAD superfamily